jgi:hypothetical protein
MKIRNTGIGMLLLFFICVFSHAAFASSWTEDFDRICAQTEDAGSLPTAQLKELVKESDKLLEVIETGNDPGKKVYIFRLRKCRNLFAYILDLRERDGGTGPKQ